jgi:hypothetical protein
MADLSIRATDAELARLRADLERQVERARKVLAADLERAPRDADGKMKATEYRELVRRSGEEMADVLDKTFGIASKGFRRASAAVLDASGDDLAALGIDDSLTAPSQLTLRAQVDGTLDDIAEIAKEGRAELRALVADSIRSPINLATALDALVEKLGGKVGVALNLADTALMGLDRAATTAGAEEAGVEWFALDHPIDQLTRPWCREHAGFRFTVAQLDGLRNTTGPNPARTYCGGYGCRGSWLALVTDDDLAAYEPWPG